MNLVYFGSGSFGLPTLDRLQAEHRVVLVVTRPDRPAGRHRRLAATPVGRYADDHGLDSIKPGDVNDADIVRRIRQAGADAFVVIAFGQKLGRELVGTGFIWTKGECGQGTFRASSSGVSVGAEKSNWILYEFDWSNA